MRTLILISFFAFATATAQTSYNYYFGNLHSHTGFSDGCQDSTSSGVSNPAGAYVFANASQHFDFLGISEHNHYSNVHNPGFKKPLYQTGMNMANTANQDGSFLALFGMEWGVSSNYAGHVVVYGFNQLIGWETVVPGVSGNNYDIFNAKGDYDGLFKKVKNNAGAFCYLAHPNSTDFSTGGNAATALTNMPYNATFDSAIVGTPLRNGLAYSTATNYNDYPASDYFNYYKSLLVTGYHVGVTYDHDNHNTTFGRSNGGRLVVMAPALTRPDLIAAMQQMHFYASDDWNAKVDFNMNGNIMGSILTGSTAPTFNLIHNDVDGEQAQTIRIWRGISNSGGIYPTVVYNTSQNNTATYTDNNLAQNKEYFYFAEIFQADGDWVVTTPIWYKSSQTIGNPVSVSENEKEMRFNYFPNPVNQKLTISMAEVDDYKITISDISGRTVAEKDIQDKEAAMDLTAIHPGVYLLTVSNKQTTISRRLIVE